MMSLTMMSALGSRNQIRPSKTLDTKKDEGTKMMSSTMWVHAYWPNWYMYIPRFSERTKETKPDGFGWLVGWCQLVSVGWCRLGVGEGGR